MRRIYMYEYIFKAGCEATIDTSAFCKDFKEIKHENINVAPNCTCMRSTYPNGFIMDMEEYADKIVLKTNRELIDNGNGTLSVSEK
jgi:hypothetical protein